MAFLSSVFIYTEECKGDLSILIHWIFNQLTIQYSKLATDLKSSRLIFINMRLFFFPTFHNNTMRVYSLCIIQLIQILCDLEWILTINKWFPHSCYCCVWTSLSAMYDVAVTSRCLIMQKPTSCSPQQALFSFQQPF